MLNLKGGLLAHLYINIRSLQDFNAGLAISVVDLTAASVKQFEKKGFEITTPFKSFW